MINILFDLEVNKILTDSLAACVRPRQANAAQRNTNLAMTATQTSWRIGLISDVIAVTL